MLLISRNDSILEFRRVEDSLFAWDIEGQFIKFRFSPGSEFFFALREDGTIEKRGSEAGNLIGRIKKFSGELFDIAFSPGGEEIASAVNDGWIHIYNAADGQSLSPLEGHAHTLDFSPDGNFLAAGLADDSIRVYSLDSDGQFDLEGHLDTVNDLKFSADGQALLSGSSDCSVNLWDINDRELSITIIPGFEQPFEVLRVDFSPEDAWDYLAGGISGLYAVKENEKIAIERMHLKDFVVSQNEQTMALTGSGTSVLTNIQEEGFLNAHQLSFEGNGLALNTDGSLLVVAAGESLEFWSTKDRTKIHSFPIKDSNLPGKVPVQLAFSPDNTLLALGYRNGMIDVFGIPGN